MTTQPSGDVPALWTAVTVAPNSTIFLDIDHTSNLNSFVLLYGPDGRGLTFNDDLTADLGSNVDYNYQGQAYSLDSGLSIKAVEGGTYYIQFVDVSLINQLPNNATFEAHISVKIHFRWERMAWQAMTFCWEGRATINCLAVTETTS